MYGGEGVFVCTYTNVLCVFVCTRAKVHSTTNAYDRVSQLAMGCASTQSVKAVKAVICSQLLFSVIFVTFIVPANEHV